MHFLKTEKIIIFVLSFYNLQKTNGLHFRWIPVSYNDTWLAGLNLVLWTILQLKAFFSHVKSWGFGDAVSHSILCVPSSKNFLSIITPVPVNTRTMDGEDTAEPKSNCFRNRLISAVTLNVADDLFVEIYAVPKHQNDLVNWLKVAAFMSKLLTEKACRR